MDTTDQPSSICHVQTIQMYQLPAVSQGSPPQFKLLAGEAIFHSGSSVDGSLLLTNYRLYLQTGDSHHHIPLGLVELVEHRDLFYLHIGCKDARSYRCTFTNNESCLEWFDRISKAAEPPRQLEQIFAFYHFIWAKDRGGDEVDAKIRHLRQYTFDHKLFKDEMERLRFEGDAWRISEANKHYKLCPTYPPYLIVPSCINDETLECVAKFRSSRRIPAVVWRHARNGAVIARCSQPEVGWLGWRSSEDEDLIKAISQACNFDQRGDKESILSHSPGSLNSEDSLQMTSEIADVNNKEKKVLIMDARSYTTAVANRARGGGCECPEYYPNCEIQFMNLANIHSIRKSFHALRLLCTSAADQPTWFSQLEGTRWLQHMSGLMKAAVTLVNAVEREARPVLVHCSDGWDRTPQIIALAELLLDPYYRTIDGFRILIEREWLAFGHKFADRCGHSSGSDDQNERCPVFLQWLDCVHQLVLQFSCAFEFSQNYLVKLAQHAYSNLYGTFLANTFQERMRIVNGKTFSVWEFLSSPQFKNHLYAAPGNSCCGSRVLWPQCNVRDLQLWNEVYLGLWEAKSVDGGAGACPGPPEAHSPSHMTKTRSYGDLKNAGELGANQLRRSSDPSINNVAAAVHNVENGGNNAKKLTDTLNGGSCCRSDEDDKNGFLCEKHCTSRRGDEIDCNSDCIFKETKVANGTKPLFKIDSINDDDDDDEEDEGGFNNSVFLQENVIKQGMDSMSNGGFHDDDDDNREKVVEEREEGSLKTEKIKNRNNDCEINNLDNEKLNSKLLNTINNGNESKTITTAALLALSASDSASPSVLNNFSNENDLDSDDNDNELTEKSESKSETTLCDFGIGIEKSVETSTDTLVSVSEKNISSSPADINGFEKVHNPGDVSVDANDGCRVCAENLKFVNDSHSGNTVRGKSRCSSSSPMYSRTSSGSGWDNGLPQHRTAWHPQPPYNLGDDGLIPVRSPAQERLWQIIEEHRRKEELLEKELHTYRQALINQFCHKCSNTDGEKADETSDSSETSEMFIASSINKKQDCSGGVAVQSVRTRTRSPITMTKPGSVVESVGSLGEGQASAVESLRSDMSWEALEEHSILTECTATLWVPDHAVSRCTGCQTEFWVGKRKHHCRKCGRIFCASCSENSTPLPSEQLYEPVRVCTGCYSKLRRDCGGEVPDQCKHANGQATASAHSQQIAASSN